MINSEDSQFIALSFVLNSILEQLKILNDRSAINEAQTIELLDAVNSSLLTLSSERESK